MVNEDFEREVIDRLARIETDIKNMATNNTHSFEACQETHGLKMKAVTEKIVNFEENIKWLWRTLIVVGLGFVANAALKHWI